MGQKRYSPKLGIDVESIARMAASKNIKDALSINPPTFSTPQNIYRFGFDYNKFEPASPKNNKPVTRQVSLQYKKGKKASGIGKRTQDMLNNTYSAENERFDYVNKNYEWVPAWNFFKNSWPELVKKTVVEETNMQKNTIKQRIANTCYNTITARLLREQDAPPLAGGDRNMGPTKSAFGGPLDAVGDTGRLMGTARAALSWADVDPRARGINASNPFKSIPGLNKSIKGLKGGAFVLQALGAAADVYSAWNSYRESDNPTSPLFNTNTQSDASAKAISALVALGGVGGVKVASLLKKGEVPSKSLLAGILPWATQTTAQKLTNTIVQPLTVAATTLITRPPVTDAGRINPVANPDNKLDFVHNFLNKFLPLPRSAPGSASTSNMSSWSPEAPSSKRGRKQIDDRNDRVAEAKARILDIEAADEAADKAAKTAGVPIVPSTTPVAPRFDNSDQPAPPKSAPTRRPKRGDN